MHVFAANLSSPTYQTQGPTWEPYYSAKAAYGSLLTPPVTDPHAELTPAVWSRIIDLFNSNDTVFQQYIDRKQRGWEYAACEGTCKVDEICQLGSAQSQFACLQASPAMRKAKRDTAESGSGHADECGTSFIRGVLTGHMS